MGAMKYPRKGFSLCESVAAGGASRWHIRELDSAGKKLGGGITTGCLCGHVKSGKGWDLSTPTALKEAIDPDCFRLYKIVISITDTATTLDEWYGIKLTDEQAAMLLKGHTDLRVEVQEFGIDTVVREGLIRALSEDLGCGDWPMNGDPPERQREHSRQFHEKAVAAGYQFRDGWLDRMLD
jgi:hypothetical protein